MENENKVVLSLEKYDELIGKSKQYEIKLKEICNLLFSYTELDCTNENLNIQLFNVEYSRLADFNCRLMDLIREIFPKEYKLRLNKLKKEYESEVE